MSAAETEEQDIHQTIVIGVAAIVAHAAQADGLMDDILALAITSSLAVSLPSEKLPRAVIMRNLQFQLRYPVREPIFYDSSLSEFASIGVSLLMGAMKEGKLEAGKVYYHQAESTENLS